MAERSRRHPGRRSPSRPLLLRHSAAGPYPLHRHALALGLAPGAFDPPGNGRIGLARTAIIGVTARRRAALLRSPLGPTGPFLGRRALSRAFPATPVGGPFASPVSGSAAPLARALGAVAAVTLLQARPLMCAPAVAEIAIAVAPVAPVGAMGGV